jgi:hypothetical protein
MFCRLTIEVPALTPFGKAGSPPEEPDEYPGCHDELNALDQSRAETVAHAAIVPKAAHRQKGERLHKNTEADETVVW